MTMRFRQALGVLFMAMVISVGILPEFRYLFRLSAPLHAVVHVLTFCLAFALTASRKTALGYSLLGMSLLSAGLFIEYVQSQIYGNALEYWDILYDALGIALGMSGRFLMP